MKETTTDGLQDTSTIDYYTVTTDVWVIKEGIYNLNCVRDSKILDLIKNVKGNDDRFT